MMERSRTAGRRLWVRILMGVAMGVLPGCSDGDEPTRSLFEDDDRETVLIFENVTVELQESVRLDSVRWLPTAVLPAPGQTLEILGDYEIAFVNDGAVALDLQNDLRFYDDDDFFVDNFIPFALPLRLHPGATTWQRGEFRLRGDPDIARFGLSTLRIVVTGLEPIPAADEGG